MKVALRCDAERMLSGLRVVQAHSQHAFRPLLPAEMASCFTQRGSAGPESGFLEGQRPAQRCRAPERHDGLIACLPARRMGPRHAGGAAGLWERGLPPWDPLAEALSNPMLSQGTEQAGLLTIAPGQCISSKTKLSPLLSRGMEAIPMVSQGTPRACGQTETHHAFGSAGNRACASCVRGRVQRNEAPPLWRCFFFRAHEPAEQRSFV